MIRELLVENKSMRFRIQTLNDVKNILNVLEMENLELEKDINIEDLGTEDFRNNEVSIHLFENGLVNFYIYLPTYSIHTIDWNQIYRDEKLSKLLNEN